MAVVSSIMDGCYRHRDDLSANISRFFKDFFYVIMSKTIPYNQDPDLYAFIGFIGPDNDDLNWLLILIFDY